MIPALSVTINHAQPRIVRDRQWVVASGIDFNGDSDGYYWQDTWIDPITHRLMLRPGPLYASWWTSNAGISAKLGLPDFTVATPSKWVEDEKFPGAGKYLNAQGISEPAITTASFPKNQAMCLSVFGYGAGDVHVVAEFGFNTTAALTGGVGWRLYSNGDTEIWKNGVLLNNKKVSSSGETGGKSQESAQSGISIQNDLITLLIIPFANREVLIVTPEGNGFSHCYGDIDETDTSPTITPAGPFWVNIPSPATANFQVAKIQWPTSGYATTRMLSFPEDPTGLDGPHAFSGESARFFSFTDYGSHTEPSFTLVGPTGGPFSPAGGDFRCRVRVNLVSDSTYTPVTYGIEVYYAAETGSTDGGSAFVLDRYITAATLDVPEHREGTTLTLTVKSPKTLDSGPARGLLSDHTPIRAKFGRSTTGVAFDECVIIDGLISEVTWHSEVDDEVQRATVKIRDYFELYDDYLFQDIKVVDGLELSRALGFILKRPGLADSDLDLETTALILGLSPAADANNWNNKLEASKQAAGAVSELLDDQAAGWPARFVPKVGAPRPLFRFESPATRDARLPALKVYGNRAAAIAGGVANDDKTWKVLYRKFEHGKLKPEANDIRVTYIDPRDLRVKQMRRRDQPAADPTLSPASRPSNWTGDTKRGGLATNKITRDDVGRAALDYLYARLTPRAPIGQIDCEMLFLPDQVVDVGGVATPVMGRPVWPGVDKIDTDTEDGAFIVTAMSTHFEKEPDEVNEPVPVQWRESHYVLGNGSGNHSGGTSMRSIQEANAIRAASGQKWLVRPGSEHLMQETPKLVTVVP